VCFIFFTTVTTLQTFVHRHILTCKSVCLFETLLNGTSFSCAVFAFSIPRLWSFKVCAVILVTVAGFGVLCLYPHVLCMLCSVVDYSMAVISLVSHWCERPAQATGAWKVMSIFLICRFKGSRRTWQEFSSRFLVSCEHVFSRVANMMNYIFSTHLQLSNEKNYPYSKKQGPISLAFC
jgi:hypothetical protein